MPYKKGLLARAPFAIHFRQQVAAATLLTSGVLFTNQAGGSAVHVDRLPGGHAGRGLVGLELLVYC